MEANGHVVRMSAKRSMSVWHIIVVLAYLARPVSCIVALNSVPVPVDDPYHTVDPHGFGLLFAMASTLILAVPIHWLLLSGHGKIDAGILTRRNRHHIAAAIAVVAMVGTPMFTQYAYFRDLPLAHGWPILVSSLIWFGIVAYLAFAPARPGRPSIRYAFARLPYLAWAIVLVIGFAMAWFI
jgi:hypothetical protein